MFNKKQIFAQRNWKPLTWLCKHPCLESCWVYWLILGTSIVCALHYNNYLILLVNLFLIKYFYQTKFNLIGLVFLFITIAFSVGFYFLIPSSFSLKKLLVNYHLEHPNSFKNIILKYLETKYQNQETFAFVKLLIFNIHDYQNILIKQLYTLNLAHLFIVSGMHLSLFVILITKIIPNKFNKRQVIVLLLLIGFYCYLLDFSVGCLRVLISILFKLNIFKRINKSDKLAFNGLILGLISVHHWTNLGYLFSYGCVLVIVIVNFQKRTLFYSVLLSLLLFLYTSPISASLNKSFNVLGLVFAYVFSLPIISLYYLCFFCLFIPGFELVLDWIVQQLLFLIKQINAIDASLKFKNVPNFLLICYFTFYLNSLLFWRKDNKKSGF